MTRRYAAIVSTGRYVPERRVDNDEMSRLVGADVGPWLVENVGIHARHFMAADQRTSDLAVAAGRQALTRAGLDPDALDRIVLATDTPDHLSPATSAVVQHQLGARNAGCFDVNAACAGWVTALDAAARTIEADAQVNHTLVIGAYGMSRYLDFSDKKTATLFADGAAAVLLSAADAPGYLAGRLAADGSFHDALGIYTGGTARPATPDNVSTYGAPRVEFARRFPPTYNVEQWSRLIRDLLGRAAFSLSDVKLFVFTQINRRAIEATMAVLELPVARAHCTMAEWGYVGSACIPMTLDDAVVRGQLEAGDHVVLCASGGGVTMAASLVRWTVVAT
ncbi:MAG: ketoacyl-ACP synthase III [Myxococcota bacterium]